MQRCLEIYGTIIIIESLYKFISSCTYCNGTRLILKCVHLVLTLDVRVLQCVLHRKINGYIIEHSILHPLDNVGAS